MTNSRYPRQLLIVPAVLAAVAMVFVVVPLIALFAKMDRASIQAVFARNDLWMVVLRSVTASAITTVLSLTLAYVLAHCMYRTQMPGKRLLRTMLELPMLIPSVSIGMGVVLLFGNSGLLTGLLNLPRAQIYGLPGIVVGSLLYSLPVAFLMISNILRYEDSSPYEAAKVLGFSDWEQFKTITLPYLRKPMIVAAFSIFTMSFTDYGVPLMVGGKYKTLPVVMYQEVIGQLNFGKGCVYGSLLLIPAVVAFLVDMASRNNANSTYVIKPFTVRKRKLGDLAAFLYVCLVAAFCILPIFSFLVLALVEKYPTNMSLSLNNIVKSMSMGGGKYLANSLTIAFMVALVGTAVAVLTAYFTARHSGRMNKFLHLVCMSMAAVPGVVLGLAYVMFFKNTALYGTLAILVIVNTVHFFASPYFMMYTSFSKLNSNLESVAATLGIGHFRLLKDVLLPRCWQTVGEMFSYFFVNSMMTISAVSFLANVRNKPIALMINQYEAQAQMEFAAVVSLAILLVNLAVKILMEYLPKKVKGSDYAE